jgi:hypothetical protein
MSTTHDTPARPLYLAETHTIEAAQRTDTPRGGYTADGYTLRRGAPSGLRLRLAGEKRWRRVYVWCFSNAATAFVRIAGVPHIVRDHDIPPTD